MYCTLPDITDYGTALCVCVCVCVYVFVSVCVCVCVFVCETVLTHEHLQYVCFSP